RTRLLSDRAQDVAVDDAGTGQPQPVEVALDRPHGIGVVLDEYGAGRTARERLDPQRAGAREEVEHFRAVDRSDEVEDVLAHPVGRGPRVEPARRGEFVPLPGTGNDTHGRIVAWRPSPSSTEPGAAAGAGISCARNSRRAGTSSTRRICRARTSAPVRRS